MSAKSLGTLPVIYAVGKLQNPLPRKRMLFEGDTNTNRKFSFEGVLWWKGPYWNKTVASLNIC